MGYRKLKYDEILFKPPDLPFKHTGEIKRRTEIVGQAKALDALMVAIETEQPHYNVFVSGPPGTGRRTAVRHILKKVKKKKRPEDKCYVYNFSNPDSPILLRFRAGEGRKFKKEFESLVSALLTMIPEVLQGEVVQKIRERIIDKYKKKEDRIYKDFEKRALNNGFQVSVVKVGPLQKPVLKPIIDGEAIDFQSLEQLVDEGKVKKTEFERIEKVYRELSFELQTVLKTISDENKRAAVELEESIMDVLRPLVEMKIAELKENFRDKKVGKFLDAFLEDLMSDLNNIIKSEGFPLKYRVNLLVDNSNVKTAPVVFENSPTFNKLFGTIEVTTDSNGAIRTDFTMIRGGSLLKADEGFLVLNAYDVLTEPGVWEKLKRTLRNGELEIQPREYPGIFALTGLKPEPIKINVKVIMIGEPYLYAILYNNDPEFGKLFKVRADFDNEMDLCKESAMQYAYVIKKVSEDEKLFPVKKDAVLRLIEYGVRLAENRKKISTEFNRIADVVREANYWARQKKKKFITEKEIREAIEHRYRRSNLIEEKILDMIRSGDIFVDVDGSAVGQINGLEIYSIGDLEFGKPVRITATVSIGNEGVVNIEREVQLSGPIHSKGVLILAGFLRERFAQRFPLSLNASICFEQSYTGIDGDSASSAELYAIISALSGVPIDQSMAVTGSVNQKGMIQPIGGVNAKIEGFFDVCKIKGLTGKQGVVIPETNVDELMLKEEVVEEIKKKKFHLYSVKTVEEGIELLTHRPASEVFKLAEKKLFEYAETLKKYK